jgi:N-acetylglucosamine-6-sulfatase
LELSVRFPLLGGRAFTAAAVATIAAVAGVGCSSSSPAERPAALPPRPNIVVVLVDDLDAVSPYWSAMPKTRALIRDRGLTFTNAFVTDPVCAPSRASILSGLYPHNNGVLDATPRDGSYKAFAMGAEPRSVAVRLQEAGYTTGSSAST